MTQLWSGRAGIWTQEVNLQCSGPSRAAVSSWVLWWWSVLCEVCYGSHNHRWLLGTWNVASAAEKLNLKFYLILNGHMWLVAMILDHIVVESNNFQNSIREVVVSFREEYSEHQWNWGDLFKVLKVECGRAGTPHGETTGSGHQRSNPRPPSTLLALHLFPNRIGKHLSSFALIKESLFPFLHY